jgi:hypothetical protein
MLAEPRRARVASLWRCLLVVVLLAPGRVRADASSESYEAQRLQRVLAAAGLEVDAAPEHKTIRYMRYARRPVFEPDDLIIPFILPRGSSTWPNVFHWLSEQSTVQREVLLQAGDPFSTTLAEESMRNLRDLGIFSLVSIVAVKTGDPTRVDVVVYTRDLWSLRFEQDFSGTGGVFSIGAQVIERNLFGRNKALAVRASLEPFRYSVGETYLDPRVLGSELRAYESFDAIFNRGTGQLEGGVGTLQVGRPFFNLAQRASYNLVASYSDQVFRDASGAQVIGFDTSPAKFGQDCPLGPDTCLARVWRDRQLQLTAAGHYRIGERYKQTFSLGAALVNHAVAANAETRLQPGQAELFREDVLPKVRRDVYPYVRYRLSLPQFVTFVNLATYGQSESVQIGPRVDGSLGVPMRAYGASSDGLIAHGLLGYIWAEHDALLDVSGEGWSRLENDRVVDQRAALQLRAASPQVRALLGRFVLRALWDGRRYDTQNTLVALGGDTGLRGYAAQYFYGFGASRMLFNAEYRSLPVIISSVHVGLVLFYDAGSVYTDPAAIRLHQALGAGLRVLFPQFNRYVFRLDVGAPLERGPNGYAVQLSYGSDQLVPLTAAEDLLAADSLSATP